MRINRQHKDRLFKFIFQEKENLLQLYNALNGTEYHDLEELEIFTLEDVIYMRMKNDISFVLDWQMNLFEHQSTDNPNMPLRGLLYFARQYEKYIAENNNNLYGTRLLLIPTPQYVVFYNGNRWEGAVFIHKIKKYSETLNIENAVDKAVNECIREGILREILISHQGELKDMILTEYVEEKTMSLFRKEFEEEAEEKVRKAEEKVREAEEKAVKAEERAAKAEKELKNMQEKLEKLQRKVEHL